MHSPGLHAIRLEHTFDVLDAISIAGRLITTPSESNTRASQGVCGVGSYHEGNDDRDDAEPWRQRARLLLSAFLLHVRYERPKEQRLDPVFAIVQQPPGDLRLSQQRMLAYPHDPTFSRGWLTLQNKPTATHPFITTVLNEHLVRPTVEAGSVVAELRSHLMRRAA